MKKASISEAKNNFSALIDSVRGGSPVLIVDRGAPAPDRMTCWPG
jgi:prevent-host-death family protein